MLSEQRIRQDIKDCEGDIANFRELVDKCSNLHEAIKLVENMQNTYLRISILKYVLEE